MKSVASDELKNHSVFNRNTASEGFMSILVYLGVFEESLTLSIMWQNAHLISKENDLTLWLISVYWTTNYFTQDVNDTFPYRWPLVGNEDDEKLNQTYYLKDKDPVQIWQLLIKLEAKAHRRR